MLMVVISWLPLVLGVPVETCECSKPQVTGVLDLTDLLVCDSMDQAEAIKFRPVKYDLFMEKSAGKSFSGYACRMWKRIKRIDEGFFWGTDTTFDEEHLIVEPTVCWHMISNSRCGENLMGKLGNVWTFTGKPQGEGSWHSVTTHNVTNCEFEKVTLDQECDVRLVSSCVCLR